MDYNQTAMEELLAWGRAGGDDEVSLDLDQWAWQGAECGTTMCLAGKAAVSAGYRFQWVDESEGDGYVATHASNSKGEVRGIRDVAREVLGLSNPEAGSLFMAEKSKRALDFLHHLIQRAKEGMGPMPVTEIAHWERRWERQNPNQ